MLLRKTQAQEKRSEAKARQANVKKVKVWDDRAKEVRAFRGYVARANVLALDRQDVQVSAKDISRIIDKPNGDDWDKLT